MTSVDAILGIAGLLVVVLILWDVFQSIVVPRPTPSRLRIAR
jgi:hypothetical protein